MADNTLTIRIAEEWINRPDSVRLEDFTEMADEAAESLSQLQFPSSFNLNGLTSLSEAAAESLRAFPPDSR